MEATSTARAWCRDDKVATDRTNHPAQVSRYEVKDENPGPASTDHKEVEAGRRLGEGLFIFWPCRLRA